MAAQDLVRTSAAAPLACKLRVRYGECDPQGVVFNAHFLAYFDVGITELFRAAFGSYKAMVDRGDSATPLWLTACGEDAAWWPASRPAPASPDS